MTQAVDCTKVSADTIGKGFERLRAWTTCGASQLIVMEFMDFPKEHRAKAHSTVLERLNSEVKGACRRREMSGRSPARSTPRPAPPNCKGKLSLDDEILYLKLAMPYAGALLPDEICDETLEPLVSALKAPVARKRQGGKETVRVRKNKTVNLVLGTIRQVLSRGVGEPRTRRSYTSQSNGRLPSRRSVPAQ